MLLRADEAVALTGEALNLQLYYDNTGSGGGTGTVLSSAVTLSADLEAKTGNFKLFGFQFTMPALTISTALWVVLARTGASATDAIQVDNWMMVRGNQALTWDASSDEDDWQTNAAASTAYTDTGSGDIDETAGGGNNAELTSSGGGNSGELTV